jgi:hypothetical protein
MDFALVVLVCAVMSEVELAGTLLMISVGSLFAVVTVCTLPELLVEAELLVPVDEVISCGGAVVVGPLTTTTFLRGSCDLMDCTPAGGTVELSTGLAVVVTFFLTVTFLILRRPDEFGFPVDTCPCWPVLIAAGRLAPLH